MAFYNLLIETNDPFTTIDLLDGSKFAKHPTGRFDLQLMAGTVPIAQPFDNIEFTANHFAIKAPNYWNSTLRILLQVESVRSSLILRVTRGNPTFTHDRDTRTTVQTAIDTGVNDGPGKVTRGLQFALALTVRGRDELETLRSEFAPIASEQEQISDGESGR